MGSGEKRQKTVVEQAREAARDDPTVTELANMLLDMPHVCYIDVDGENDDWRPTAIRVSFNDDVGRGVEIVADIMARAGWRLTSGAFCRNRLDFVPRGSDSDDDTTDAPARRLHQRREHE